MKRIGFSELLRAAGAAALLVGAGPAHANTFTVTNTNDSGAGSLRAAVAAAEALSDADTINFAPGVTGTVTLTTGEMQITRDVTIVGPGADVLAVSANHNGRIFSIPSGNVSLSGLTFKDGLSDFGAAIANQGALWISDARFIGNVATVAGGALVISPGATSIVRCSFVQNSAPISGGAIAVAYTGSEIIRVYDSYFQGNAATYGAGIFSDATHLVVSGSAFSGNAGDFGAGIFSGTGGSLALRNDTFSGNWAQEGTLHFDANGSITNSIVWGNTGPSFYGPPTVNYSNIEGGAAGSGNLNVDPRFVRNPSPGPDGKWDGVNDDYGDLRLQPASPCLNTGDTPSIAPDTADLDSDTDTAEPTPLDLDGNARVSSSSVDMGAYEFQVPEPLTGNVTANTSRTVAGFSLNAATRTYLYYVQVKNTSSPALPIVGPVSLVLEGLPAGAVLSNRAGLTPGTQSPYLTLYPTGGMLTPGQGLLFVLRVTSPTPLTGALPGTVQVIAGPNAH